MPQRTIMRTLIPAMAVTSMLMLAPVPATAAEPLLSQGIGTSACSRVAGDIKPAEGLSDPVNLMLYAWMQGYISAANVALLEYDGRYVNMADLSVNQALQLIQDYCKAHPDKKPANALDTYLKTTKKGKAEWQTGTVEWDE